MNYKMLKRMLFCVLSIILISGCTSKAEYYKSEQKVLTYQVSDISFQFQSLSETDLLELYGHKENPFVSYPGRIPRKDFFIFRMTVTTEETALEFSRDDIHILIGENEYKSLDENLLLKAWDPYFEDNSAEIHMKMKIRKNLKTDHFHVTPQTQGEELVPFLIPVGDRQRATITILATTPEGDQGYIEIPFEISDYRNDRKAKTNTGVFVQS